MKVRLLLVDDERNILEGLQRLLRPLRAEWEVRTAGSAREALSMLEQQPADVVVSDMRMPEMDGAAFLARVKDRFPSVVRIVLSGQTDPQAALRVVPVAHQFLSKPCEPAVLLETLGRVGNALKALGDERVGAALGGGVGSLPPAPAVWVALTEMLRDENVSAARVGGLLEGDPAIAAKLLQLTNSPFFGLRRRISNIVGAVAYLGIAQVKSVVLALGAAQEFPVRAARFDAHAYQQHSMKTGQIARCLALSPEQADDCFAAGLLHDIGKLLLASATPERYDVIASAAAASGRTFEEEESAAMDGPPHTHVGVHLLNVWGLPWEVVSAVANYPNAPQVESTVLGTAGAVYLAHQLLQDAADGAEVLDRTFVDRVGLGGRVAEWRARAAQVVGS